ncbi:hypothetical protein [Amniculibacterium aquaticum]|uniref:hypothetical protein n=1 Tax=Amniculibacterium aquaticum TaxID=2479858 RepID=UPI000F59942A|nr:hypothetical protein [Amniculibacterium aquaticum]
MKNYERGVLKIVVNKDNVAESFYFIEKNDPSLNNKIGQIRDLFQNLGEKEFSSLVTTCHIENRIY